MGFDRELTDDEKRALMVFDATQKGVAMCGSPLAHSINNIITVYDALHEHYLSVAPQSKYLKMFKKQNKKLGGIVSTITDSLYGGSRKGTQSLSQLLGAVKDYWGHRSSYVEFIHSVEDQEFSFSGMDFAYILHAVLENLVDVVETYDQKEVVPFSLSMEEAQGFLIFTLSHPGSIDPSIQESIFKPFFTTKEKLHRFGVGLTASSLLAERNGGSFVLLKREPVTYLLKLPK